jgi:hypothetical protein
MPRLRYGHAPGHVRDTALAAFEAWLDWDGNTSEPTVEYEINYAPRQIPISQACGLVWNCTDIVPGSVFGALQSAAEGKIGRHTYAACARFILGSITAAA